MFGGDYSNSSACVPMEELNLARWNVRRKGRTCEAVLEPGPSPPASRSPVSAGLELRPPAAPSDSGRVPRAAEHRHAATVPRSRARSAPLPGDAALFRDGAAGLRPAERLGRARRGARGDRAARVRSCGRARGGSAAGAARPRSGCGPPAIRRGRGGASWAGPPPVQARSGAGTSRPALLGGCRRWSGPSAEGGGPGPGSGSLGYGRCGRGSPAVRPPRSGPARTMVQRFSLRRQLSKVGPGRSRESTSAGGWGHRCLLFPAQTQRQGGTSGGARRGAVGLEGGRRFLADVVGRCRKGM